MPLLGTNVIFIFCILLYKMKWNKTSLQQFGAETEQEQNNTKVKENSRHLNLFRWRTSPPNRSLFYFNIQMSCGRISFCLPFFVQALNLHVTSLLFSRAEPGGRQAVRKNNGIVMGAEGVGGRKGELVSSFVLFMQFEIQYVLAKLRLIAAPETIVY